MGYGGRGYGYTEGGYGYGVSDFVGVADVLRGLGGDPYSGWAIRRLSSRYTGPTCRLRRSSDNAELDLFAQGSLGLVSTDTVRAWNGWNLLARSQELENAAWGLDRASVVQNAITAPDGTLTADKLIEDTTAANTHAIRQTIVGVAGANYTFSFYAKAGERSFVRFWEAGTTGRQGFFDLSNGTATNSTLNSIGIENVGNGWYRCYGSITNFPTSSNFTYRVHLTPDGTSVNYNGDGSSGAFLWGLQLEVGSVATTYEPRTTTGAGSSFLVTLYDQTGASRHFTQATTTLQPIVCESGVPVTQGGRLAAKFVAADARRMAVASSTALYNFLHTTGGTIATIHKSNDTASQKVLVANRASTTQGFWLLRGISEQIQFACGRRDVAGVPTNGNTAILTSPNVSLANMSTITLADPDNETTENRVVHYVNGSLQSESNAETSTPFVENAADNLTLGAYTNGASPFDGTIQEILIWDTLISDAVRDAYEADAGRFYGITVA